MSVVSRPSLTWTAAADRSALEKAGAEVVEFAALRRQTRARAARADGRRTTLDNPAADWLARVAGADPLAVLGVQIRDLDDLATLHGQVLEPALRHGTPVVIESEHRLTRLVPERFVDPGFEYPYTLERALHAAMALFRPNPEPAIARGVPAATVALDAEQRRAVLAHDGVVQVIAPAGSGKTTVLIERVRELLRRGTLAERILCTTFNRDARIELQERLRASGLGSVEARTFHSIGLWLMREEGLTRPGGVRELSSVNQWRRLCAIANQEEGVWIEPADARAAISDIKLGLLATPAEFRRQADRHENGAAIARIYGLYEQQLVEQQVNDFDDMVLMAVRALRENDDVRRRWQSRFRQVLVDEYQDIEPAQELLVRILAAPQDGFFCVGDEDQTLYGWRRASVRRILDLDVAYPGLQRISLAHNYRCPPEIVAASRSLIEHNRIRFPKPIMPDPRRPTGEFSPVALREDAGQAEAAGTLAAELADASRGEVVVLARTTNLLRTVALAFSELGVKIAAPEQVFEPHGARAALEAYLRLCSDPRHARADDVVIAFRRPSRGLPFESEERVAELLREGLSFTDAVAQVPATERQRARLANAGATLDVLRAMTRAADFISYLRGPGGLDEYFAAHEKTFAASEQIELEVLEQSEREAGRRTVAEYADLLQQRSDRLRAVRDELNGLELTTIHRAKGRQWPVVHVFAVEEGQLPHSRALDVGPEERAAGEGLEAERRLAYVAITRAQRALVIHASREAPSQFLAECGLAPSRPAPPPERPRRARSEASRSPRRAPARDRPARPNRWADAQAIPADVAQVLNEAERVGLAYALRTAVTTRAALRAAATAVERRLAGPRTASTRLTVAELLAAIERLGDAQRARVLLRAELDGCRRVAELGARPRARLAHALRELASASAD